MRRCHDGGKVASPIAIIRTSNDPSEGTHRAIQMRASEDDSIDMPHLEGAVECGKASGRMREGVVCARDVPDRQG
jgi:hypothetical protein